MPDSPTRVALFNQIASHVYDTIQGNGEPAHKKRRVDVDQANGSVNGSANGTKVNNSANTITNAADEAVLLEIKEISVSVPQRKKLEICFTANHLYARVPGTTAPIPAITHAWTDIGTTNHSTYSISALTRSRVCFLSSRARENSGTA